jgi:hypothetical protein
MHEAIRPYPLHNFQILFPGFLCVLYITLASVVWNSVTSTDANRLERI